MAAVDDVTIGRYLPRDTRLHRLDPRMKLLALAASIVLVFVYEGWGLLAFAGVLATLLVAARLPLGRVLASLRTVWVIVVVTFLLQAFLTPGEVVWQWGFLSVTDAGLYNGALFSGRVVVLVVLLAVLTMTTPPLKLADGLESGLRPLRGLRIPIEAVTTVVSIVLTFVPNVLEQSRRLVRAQAARGADFESANVLRRVRDLVPVLVPVFVKVFRDAELLSVAMEARAYAGGRGRTRLYPLKATAPEVLLTAAFIAAVVALAWL